MIVLLREAEFIGAVLGLVALGALVTYPWWRKGR